MSDEMKEPDQPKWASLEWYVAESERLERRHTEEMNEYIKMGSNQCALGESNSANWHRSLLPYLRELQASRELLEEAEWVMHEDDQGDWYSCPWCGAMATDPDKGKHVKTCTYLALKGADHE